MKFLIKILIISFFLTLNVACSEKEEPKSAKSRFKNVEVTEKEAPAVKITRPELIRTFNHDKTAYTQGLLYYNGILYESTGQRGQSRLMKLNPQHGGLIEKVPLADKYFGEGIAEFNGKIYYLTWTSQTCFVFDAETLKEEKSLAYYTQGWGLASDGTYLLMSDGSSFIRFVDPEDFSVIKSVRVRMNGKPVEYLNELEYVNGKVYANVWMKDHIVVFDPETGIVSQKIEAGELRENEADNPGAEAFNGIAYNPETGHFIVTGKNWQNFYEVKLNSVE